MDGPTIPGKPRCAPDSPVMRDPAGGYRSPLEGRYASAEMQAIWSDRKRFEIWRLIWLAVAEAQHELGLPVSAEQVAELRANLTTDDHDLSLAAEYERRLRHDVMAHVHAWGDRCPKARGIIHLGMTSQDINDNAELLLISESLMLVERKIARAIIALSDFAERWKTLPALGFTHYQPAQPTTVGRRAAQWAYDLCLCGDGIGSALSMLCLRGLRGATGTQASFLSLCDGDGGKVDDLEALALRNLMRSWRASLGTGAGSTEPQSDDGAETPERFDLTGQTYPRVLDTYVLGALGSTAAALHKIATDIRLLSNRKEIDEPFESDQIGSSAMPYKRNPMRCERICALSRFVWNLVGNSFDTAATQWLERTLDDSANRRLSLPEAFLALDGCLDLMHNVARGLIVHEAQVRRNLMAELPFMASENLMMEAVRLGRDRQEVHEVLRGHARDAGARVKNEGAENDLIDRLRNEPLLAGVDLDRALEPGRFTGRAAEQTERFLRGIVDALREDFGDVGADDSELRV